MFEIPKDRFSAVEIEINSNCNMSCSYCPNSEHERLEQGDMKPEQFEKIMRQLKEMNFLGRVSYHFYNEPLLSKNLDSFVKMTREYLPECVIVIYSNGTLLTEKRMIELLTIGVTSFFITKHEDVKKSYVFSKTFSLLSDDLKKRVDFQDFTQIDLSNRAGLLKDIDNGDVSSIPCFLPLYLVVITLKGNVLPCYEDFYQKLTMGNINDNSLLDIWNSEKYTSFRETLRSRNGRKSNNVCKDCSCVRF
jgi:radical SAM protein with 4Fe4S-binding SPASM domain